MNRIFSLYTSIFISLLCIGCNEEADPPIPESLSNAHLTIYSWDCIDASIDCLENLENRLAGVSHSLYLSEETFMIGSPPRIVVNSDLDGLSNLTNLEEDAYYLVSEYEGDLIMQYITTRPNTLSYTDVIFQ